MAGIHPAHVEAKARPQRRWARRLLIVAILFLVILVGLLAISDRAAVGIAERAVAEQIRQQLVNQRIQASDPRVEINGFPFLTQVLAGRYESMSVHIGEAAFPADRGDIHLSQLEVEVRAVTASLDTLRTGRGEAVAETLTGGGVITYDSIARLIDRPGVRLAERDGELWVDAPVEALGRQVTVTGTADLSVANGAVRIRFTELTADGLPATAQTLMRRYAEELSVDIPLRGLPFRLDVQRVEVRPEGLAVTAAASNVPLNTLG